MLGEIVRLHKLLIIIWNVVVGARTLTMSVLVVAFKFYKFDDTCVRPSISVSSCWCSEIYVEPGTFVG